ncbi:MAG: tail fiber domain-containing protein [Gemella haemolysans]|uniref:tail fiber domain-containing protein n=1 Tax=Gemella haemolysans TaxID=1379 RepID=UPI003FA085A3
MIIRLVNEKNLVKATEVKLIKTSDYQDTLTFKLPIDEEIAVDELIGVRTKVMKQDYRVKEIITKDKYRDVYCEHKFFDCKNIIIPYVDEANRGTTSYNNFENYTNLQLIAGHLNRIMRTKGDTEYKFTTEVNRSGVIECDDTPLYDLIFGEKGILKTFNVELVYDNYRVKFVEKRPSKNTEILFHEKKNISELQATVDFKEIITKLHVTCKYTPETTEEQREEKERARAAKRLETFNKSQERIRQREEKQAKERALKRKKEEEDYRANRKKPKRTKAQIHAEHVQRQQERENRILAGNETRRAERERKFAEREQQRAAQRVTRKKEKEKLILKTVYVSPLVDHYARPYEASLSFDSKEINSEEALIAWCQANIFTEEDPRDVPISNFSFKPTLDNYNVDINDRAMVNFESLDTNKVIHCCKIEYDALHDKYISIEFGELNKSTMKEAIGSLNAKISEANSNISRGFNMIDSEIEAYVQKELEAYNELFDIEKEELEDNINQGIEDAKIEAEKVYGTINTELEEQLAPIREDVRNTVEAYNQQLQATKLELEKNKTESIEKIKELTDRVNNVQDISTNPTVIELKQQVAEAKESGNAVKSKVTELEGSITREFTSVKSKTENDLNVVKAEFTKGVDGLTRKISSLEEYKNQDGSRTESLKQWVQRDTTSQLSRERTEITRIVDEKGFVKNTEFSSKFNDNAQGINRKLDALETYKNQDETRTSALKQWTQENTASQLSTARSSIESWVDNKGYATTSVVNNKVQEAANSFSREISNVRESIPTSVGGRNYIPNSNFAKDFKNWEDKLTNSGLQYDKGHALKHFGRGLHIWGTPNNLHKGLSSVPFDLTAEQGEKLTLSMDLGKDFLNNYSILDVRLHYMDGETILSQELQKIDLATQGFVAKKYKRISIVFTVPLNITKCRVMIYAVNGQIANFYIDNIKLEKGNIATDWTPATEDDQQSINELNSWKQTTTGTLNTVTSTLNDTVRHSQLQITADSINFGSNKVFNGRSLASMLSVSPDSIKAITDRLVITPTNENLVLPEYRRNSSFKDDMQISEKFDIGKTKNFLIKGKARTNSYENRFRFATKIIYKDGTNYYTTGIDGNNYINGGEFSIPFKIYESEKEIENVYFTIDRYGTPIFDELSIVPQKSAELIVDGTIEGKHIKSSTIETGHLKTGSVTANIIASDAIESKHLKVSDAMIDKLVGNKAFVSKLWAKEAFINNLESVKIKSTQIDAFSLTGAIISGGILRGETKIQIGKHGYMIPAGNGLRFCLPKVDDANNGVGMQLLGNYGREGNSAYGLYLYVDPNFDTKEVKTTDSYLMTVAGYIKTRGVNNLKFINYDDHSTAIGIWDTDVTLKFDRTKNDIMYAYKSNYSLWGIIKSHYDTTSDIRLKKDIQDCKYNALDLIDSFKFKSFNWNYHEEFGQKPYTEIGLIAQDVEKISENFVSMAGEYKTLNQFNLLTYSLKAIQELSTENKELKQRITKLEEKVNG